MKKILVLNHKMYLTYNEIENYIRKIKDNIRSDLDVIVCPSSIFIPYFTGKYDFLLGSQNLCSKLITGEISGKQLKSFNVKYTLIGHSERKTLMNETNKDINDNIRESLNNNITPIVCIGETLEQKERKKTGEVIVKELKEYFYDIDVKEDIIIAYEPTWVTKSNKIPSNKYIYEAVELIKNIMLKRYNVNVKVIYGGGVNSHNIESLNKISNIDGYLLGELSTEPSKLLEIMNKI